MLTKEVIDHFFAAEAVLLNTGYRREVFLFRGFVVKRTYRGYKRTADLNYHEFDNFRQILAKIPAALRINFQTIHSVVESGSETYLVTEAILDDSGEPSKSVADLGPLSDAAFWQRLAEVIELLARLDICLTDLHAKNVLACRREGRLIPVIVDYKTMGRDFAPWQIELFFRVGRAHKMYRKFARMQKEFRRG